MEKLEFSRNQTTELELPFAVRSGAGGITGMPQGQIRFCHLEGNASDEGRTAGGFVCDLQFGGWDNNPKPFEVLGRYDLLTLTTDTSLTTSGATSWLLACLSQNIW